MENMYQPGEREEALRHFGAEAFAQAEEKLRWAAEQWALTDVRFIPYYSINCVYMARSSRWGEAVLKIGRPAMESRTERDALLEYQGRGFCRLLNDDVDRGILLVERVLPGTRLRDVPSLPARLDAFAAVRNGLHRPAKRPDQYPTYVGWVESIAAHMATRSDCPALSRYMADAAERCRALAGQYGDAMLLHGDLHHDNLLLGPDGRYVVIDPKGVVGDPVFEIGRFILNEDFGGDPTAQLLQPILMGLAQRLNYPPAIIADGYWIELCMGLSWMAEQTTDEKLLRRYEEELTAALNALDALGY